MSSRVGLSFLVLAAFAAGLLVIGPIADASENAVVVGTCKSKTSACVTGINAKPGAAVAGLSKGVGVAGFGGSTPAPGAGATGLGVYGQGAKQGVVGLSATGVGVTGIAGLPPTGSSSGVGVIGSGPTYGVVGQSAATGVLAGSSATNSGTFALQVLAFTGASLFQATNGSTGLVTIAPTGDIHTTGKVFTMGGTCTSGCSVHRKVESYASSAALPQIEDTGESQLRFGAAYVRLNPDFANVIDPRAGYLVLVTPEGATSGVYVTERTMSGFAVRENPGGHSNSPFAYRIVAHPYGDRSQRLPFRTLEFPSHL